jgi:hypothetical protein
VCSQGVCLHVVYCRVQCTVYGVLTHSLSLRETAEKARLPPPTVAGTRLYSLTH